MKPASRPAAREANKRLKPEPCADRTECSLERQVLTLRGTAMTVLDFPGLEPAVANDDAVRDAKQLRIRELDARPCVAIVEEHFDACIRELRIQTVRDLGDVRRLLRI